MLVGKDMVNVDCCPNCGGVEFNLIPDGDGEATIVCLGCPTSWTQDYPCYSDDEDDQ